MDSPPEYKHALNADSPTNQANQHQNPIEKYRRSTDSLCMFVFPVIVIVWVVIGILGFTAPDNGKEMDEDLMNIQWYFNAPLHRFFSALLIVPFIITIVVLVLCTIMIEKYTKFMINIGLGLFLLATIISGYKAIIGVVSIFRTISVVGIHSYLFYSIGNLIYTWISTIYMATCGFCCLKADKKVLCDLAKDSCRAILRNPSIIFFMCLITIVVAMVTSFTFNALIFHIFASQSTYLTLFYALTILLCGIYVASFIIMLSIVVVSEFAINYYWNKDTEASSHYSIVNALRNHSGTIMFASTILVSNICGIVQALKHKKSRNNRENNFIHFVTKVYLAVRMPEIALIFTSIHGTGFAKSSKTALDVVLRRASLFLATLAAWDAMWYIPAILVGIGSAIVLLVVVGVTNMNTVEDTKNLSLIVHGFIYPLSSFVLLLWFTMKALVVNKIIMLNKEDQDTEGKTQAVNYS